MELDGEKDIVRSLSAVEPCPEADRTTLECLL